MLRRHGCVKNGLYIYESPPSGPRASNSVTKDLADIWPFKADYKDDNVIYLIKSEEGEPVTSANATKLNIPGVEGGQNQLFSYFVDGVLETGYSRPFFPNSVQILLGSAAVSLLLIFKWVALCVTSTKLYI